MTRLKRIGIALLLLALAALGLLLAVDNHTPVALRFLNYATPAWPAFWWLYAAFAGGTALGCALCGAALARTKLRERRLQRALAAREREQAAHPGDAGPG